MKSGRAGTSQRPYGAVPAQSGKRGHKPPSVFQEGAAGRRAKEGGRAPTPFRIFSTKVFRKKVLKPPLVFWEARQDVARKKKAWTPTSKANLQKKGNPGKIIWGSLPSQQARQDAARKKEAGRRRQLEEQKNR